MRSYLNTKAVPTSATLRNHSGGSNGRVAPSERRSTHTSSRTKGKFRYLLVGLGIDMPFMILVLVLLAIGILMMFSASYPFAYAQENDSYYYLKRQCIFAVIGIAAMIGLSYLNYHVFYRFAKSSLLLLMWHWCLYSVCRQPWEYTDG